MAAVGEERDGSGNVLPQDRYEVLVIGSTDQPFTAETGPKMAISLEFIARAAIRIDIWEYQL